MDDGEGGLSFDFEGGLDVGPTHPTASNPVTQPPYSSTAVAAAATVPPSTNFSNPATAPPSTAASDGGTGMNSRRSYRQTVCRHWLRSLCMKGDACGFLHQYDKARMPVCRFFRQYGECREQDCVYKHTNEDIKECNMYKLGFCPNGPDCRYRHAKLPGPPPPVEEILQKIQQLTSFNYGNTNRFFHNRNNGYAQQPEKSQFQVPNGTTYQIAKSTVADSPIVQSQQSTIPNQQQTNQVQGQNFPDGKQNQASKAAAPLPQGTSRYFIVKSCNRENLDLSVQQGVWATQRSNEAKLNEAFDSVENVILIFSINRTRHFQGCAKMTSRIGGSVSGGNWKHAHGTGHYGRNFSVKWLKLCELSFHKTRHLRNPFNENLPVKISRDCQELEPSVGEQLASLLYLEPDSELMAICVAAEAKREEEKAKGINTDNRTEDPDIVPFEDNEEEEEEEDEEESEEEDEIVGLGYGPGAQGRGRGRGGMMWPPLMPLARGSRPPPPGFRGFPPGMMGNDGFGFSGVTPDGFPLPDLSGMAPRPPFGPYGPRFFGDFAGPGSGMMFHGRPQPGIFQGGGGGPGVNYGMMMGPGRGPPFMGFGPGAPPPRPNRPVGMPPFFPPQSSQQPIQNSNRSKTQRVSMNEKSDRPGSYPDQAKGQDTVDDDLQRTKPSEQEHYGGGNGLRNEASDSEDEAPRRSRHGEGKKKRRSAERDSANGSEH